MSAQPSVHQIFSGLSNDEQEILDQADKFGRNEFYPLAQRMDDEEWWPTEIFPKIGATGYFGVTAPAEFGGAEMDLFSSGLVLQAFGRWNHALALAWVAHENLCLHNILRNANAEQKNATCRSWSAANGSVHSASPSPVPAPMQSVRCAPQRAAKAITTFSTAAKFLSLTARSQMFYWFTQKPIRTKARKVYRHLSSRRTFLASASRKN
jgi:hypothetical protein